MNPIVIGDCRSALRDIDTGSIDLIFADPPYNIGYAYDKYDDRKSYEDYIRWSSEWTSEAYRVLKDTGTLWLAMGDDFVAEMKVLLTRKLPFYLRSWVVWYYTFGVNCTRKFTRSHTHLLYLTKSQHDFTFNADAIRVPSARQLEYQDKRANALGRLPDDTWYFPRVCGTFKERAAITGCQMPEQLLARIMRASSNEGDVVLDPFAGSGSTLTVAKKLRRRYVGIELSERYASDATMRLAKTIEGDAVEGAEPSTVVGETRQALRNAGK